MPPAPYWFLDELGGTAALAVSEDRLMLWAYVDDSNIHDRTTGKVVTAGHGGGIAPLENWKFLEGQWKSALSSEGVSVFHMTDFESNNGEFKGWDMDRHQRFLKNLLDIIRQNISCFVAYSVPRTPGKTFKQTYTASLGRMLYYCGEQAKEHADGKINLVFADHPEVKTGRIASFLDMAWRAFPEVASFTGARPTDCYALQAADLLAYELVRWRGVPDATSARFPIRHLMTAPNTPSCRVFHALA
jgi:hypothetical protein